MSALRKPVVGEVWTTMLGHAWKCVGTIAGDDTLFAWLTDGDHLVSTTQDLYPPKPQPPAWLAERWLNVYPFDRFGLDAVAADELAGSLRVGRVSLAGEWVPCDGKTVLA